MLANKVLERRSPQIDCRVLFGTRFERLPGRLMVLGLRPQYDVPARHVGESQRLLPRGEDASLAGRQLPGVSESDAKRSSQHVRVQRLDSR